MSKSKSVAGTPAEPTVQFTDLEIDGETYQLAWDFGAIARAEKMADCNLLQGIAAVFGSGMNASQLRGLFYAALQRAQPKITLAEVDALIRIDTMPDIKDGLLLAWNASLPEKKRMLLADPPAAGSAPAET